MDCRRLGLALAPGDHSHSHMRPSPACVDMHVSHVGHTLQSPAWALQPTHEEPCTDSVGTHVGTQGRSLSVATPTPQMFMPLQHLL